jgi:hypothetical protein
VARKGLDIKRSELDSLFIQSWVALQDLFWLRSLGLLVVDSQMPFPILAASRGRSEIAVLTSDREQLRESVGVSTMRQSAIELARKQLSAHNVERSAGIDLATGVNRSAGQHIGDQHSSVPTHAPEPEKTPHVGLDHDLGGLGLGLGH